MFSRSLPSSEGKPPTSSGPTDSPGSEAARAFDQVLGELQPPGAPATEPDAASVTAQAEEHAATLRATRGAHEEAQAMLAVASEARKQASEEAERIVLEARDAAERTRQELAGWAAAQRAKVDALAADMVESANRDADAIRAEALRTSMAEAEETAREYVAEAAARAHRDADAIRGEAGNVLHRATELGDEVAEAIDDLTTTVADIMSRLRDASTAVRQLLAETPRPETVDPGDPADPDEAETADAAEGAEESARPGQADAADDADGETDETGEAGEAGEEPASATDTTTDPSTDPLMKTGDDGAEETDSLLGSMFRRHGQRGE